MCSITGHYNHQCLISLAVSVEGFSVSNIRSQSVSLNWEVSFLHVHVRISNLYTNDNIVVYRTCEIFLNPP